MYGSGLSIKIGLMLFSSFKFARLICVTILTREFCGREFVEQMG